LRNAQVRLLRDNVVVYEGKLSSLRRIKDDVREVASGYECGIGLENFNDIKVGDIIESFEIEKIATKL
jgi:translation initiation factor IF-2